MANSGLAIIEPLIYLGDNAQRAARALFDPSKQLMNVCIMLLS